MLPKYVLSVVLLTQPCLGRFLSGARVFLDSVQPRAEDLTVEVESRKKKHHGGGKGHDGKGGNSSAGNGQEGTTPGSITRPGSTTTPGPSTSTGTSIFSPTATTPGTVPGGIIFSIQSLPGRKKRQQSPSSFVGPAGDSNAEGCSAGQPYTSPGGNRLAGGGKELSVDPSTAYVNIADFPGGGNITSTFALDPDSGALAWSDASFLGGLASWCQNSDGVFATFTASFGPDGCDPVELVAYARKSSRHL